MNLLVIGAIQHLSRVTWTPLINGDIAYPFKKSNNLLKPCSGTLATT